VDYIRSLVRSFPHRRESSKASEHAGFDLKFAG
jgi:hypothetical protein